MAFIVNEVEVEVEVEVECAAEVEVVPIEVYGSLEQDSRGEVVCGSDCDREVEKVSKGWKF
jgi:hypothetical protein